MVQQTIELRGSTASTGGWLPVGGALCVPGVVVVGVLVQGERWFAEPALAVAFLLALAALAASSMRSGPRG